MGRLSSKRRWAISLGILGVLVAFGIYEIVTEAPIYRFFYGLATDRAFVQETLGASRWDAPLIFVSIQALQVILSPIPGEATGILGGYLFGLSLGFIYSTIGVTVGTTLAFLIGRELGVPVLRRYVSSRLWERMGFIVETEGAILVFVIYLIPGFPKDILSYLFGISPIPAWVFVAASALGRMPGTWVLSAQGSRTATGEYTEVALIGALVLAAVVPLFYYHRRILSWLRGRASETGKRA
ncbi:MAG: TVP38/TMEM64 family protein [Candidatus Methylomirabilia bacterium]